MRGHCFKVPHVKKDGRDGRSGSGGHIFMQQRCQIYYRYVKASYNTVSVSQAPLFSDFFIEIRNIGHKGSHSYPY